LTSLRQGRSDFFKRCKDHLVSQPPPRDFVCLFLLPTMIIIASHFVVPGFSLRCPGVELSLEFVFFH
jgi:hypothetical protein